jgi:hypothetical protein
MVCEPIFPLNPTKRRSQVMTVDRDAEDFRAVAAQVFDFLFPLVLMDVTRRKQTGVDDGKPGNGPLNKWSHFKDFPSPEFSKTIIRPNLDTLYGLAWIDLRHGPVVIHKPRIERYHIIQFLDMWTETFATVGSRTTGNHEEDFLLVGPSYDAGYDDVSGMQVVVASTEMVWAVARIEAKDEPSDRELVNLLQDEIKILPFGDDELFSKTCHRAIEEEPLKFIQGLHGLEFFEYGLELMRKHSPHVSDQPMLFRAERHGFFPGLRDRIDHNLVETLDEVKSEGVMNLVNALRNAPADKNGWVTFTKSIGSFGTDYARRGMVALAGIGANKPEDAVYPILTRDEDSEVPSGEHVYELTFAPGELPPAGAFWSITAYDADGFLIENSIDRYRLGSEDEMEFNEDGSLTILVSHEPQEPESNWLPVPAGPLGLTLRIYDPAPEVLRGEWQAPPLRRR